MRRRIYGGECLSIINVLGTFIGIHIHGVANVMGTFIRREHSFECPSAPTVFNSVCKRMISRVLGAESVVFMKLISVRARVRAQVRARVCVLVSMGAYEHVLSLCVGVLYKAGKDLKDLKEEDTCHMRRRIHVILQGKDLKDLKEEDTCHMYKERT
jgi:hypothetical protein